MPGGILDDNDYLENELLSRGQRGGRGPVGGPGVGPAGISLGYGSGSGTGGGFGPGYTPAGGFARRRRRPLGGFSGQPPATVDGAISAIRGGQTAGPMRSGQPVAEGGAPAMSPMSLNTARKGSSGRYSGNFGGMQDLIRRMQERRAAADAAAAAGGGGGGGVDSSDEWNRIMRIFIDQGLLSPEGSAQEWDSIKGEVNRANDAGMARALTRAKLGSDGDPQATAFAKIMAEVGGNQARTAALGGARAGILDRQQRLGQALYGRGLEQDWGFDTRQQGYELQRALSDSQRGSWLDGLLGMAGDVGGSFLGGWATEAGRRRGGGR